MAHVSPNTVHQFEATPNMRVVLPLVIVVFYLFSRVLGDHCTLSREFQAAFLSVDWMFLLCVAIWCGTLIFLTFRWKDWPLIGLLLIAIAWYCISHTASSRAVDAIILLTSVMLGRGARFLLGGSSRCESAKTKDYKTNNQSGLTSAATFLIGLILLLAFASWWHLDLPGAYRGPRWMGLWNNPNIYGMLMGTGSALAIGLLVAGPGFKAQNPKPAESAGRNIVKDSQNLSLQIFLFIAAGMMGLGLVMSYSRGSWLATAVGILYLAWCYGKLKWQYVVLGAGCVALGAGLFWGRTVDTDPWYLKRLDFSRPSAQHRVSAWRGAVQMMWDHPLGVGWNRAVNVYDKQYSPPEGGAPAITMNSYLMLGTELGLPALLCFIAYIYIKFKPKEADSLQVACRAGAVVLLVAFWFDGGLFDLPTATVFWVLLELGTSDLIENRKCPLQVTSLSS